MARKAPTKAEREHMGKVAALGCIVCRLKLGIFGTPPEIHHIRSGTGGGRRASHFDTLPLCPEHHRYDTGVHGLGTRGFERYWGISELELLAEVRRLLAPH